MYNRYIPQEGYTPVEPVSEPRAADDSSKSKSSPFSFLSSLLGGGTKGEEKKTASGLFGGLSGILDKVGLGRLDRGDILLLLVLIYLFRETEDDEWLIILALVLLMGL